MGETDLSRLKVLLGIFGIKYIETQNEYIGTEFEETRIKIEEGVGYYGFYATFSFDVEGKFVEYGVWE